MSRKRCYFHFLSKFIIFNNIFHTGQCTFSLQPLDQSDALISSIKQIFNSKIDGFVRVGKSISNSIVIQLLEEAVTKLDVKNINLKSLEKVGFVEENSVVKYTPLD